MSSDTSTVPRPAAAGPLASRAVALDTEVALVQLQLEVAAAVVPQLADCLPDPADRQAVVVDIVDCWQHLPEAVRAGLRAAECRRGLCGFADDYAELINEHLQHDPEYQPPAVGTCLLDDHVREYLWRGHLADIRDRAVAGQPPRPAWLAHFPIPEDRWV